MYMPFYFDPYYFTLIIPALLLGLWAQARVKSTYMRYSGVYGARGVTGQQAARKILDENGLHNVRIERVAGNLSDHYDPRTKVVRLSEGVFDSSSIAAVGVAAHECGHAIQHAQRYAFLTLRNAIIPATNIGTKLAIPLLLFGLFFSFYPLVWIGLVGYALLAVFQLVTLPVEYNASSRAMAVIQGSHMLDEEEARGARKVLNAAALTYVAALVSSVAQLLRLLLIVTQRQNNRRN